MVLGSQGLAQSIRLNGVRSVSAFGLKQGQQPGRQGRVISHFAPRGIQTGSELIKRPAPQRASGQHGPALAIEPERVAAGRYGAVRLRLLAFENGRRNLIGSSRSQPGFISSARPGGLLPHLGAVAHCRLPRGRQRSIAEPKQPVWCGSSGGRSCSRAQRQRHRQPGGGGAQPGLQVACISGVVRRRINDNTQRLGANGNRW